MKRCIHGMMVGVLFAALLLAIVPSRALAYATDFENFEPGTRAEDLNVSGVTFSSSPAGAFEVQYGEFMTLSGLSLLEDAVQATAINVPKSVQLRALQACVGDTLRLDFATMQASVSFKYATQDYSGALDVTGYSAGNSVYSNTFTASIPSGGYLPEGVAGFSANVDAVVISAPNGCFAIDDLSTTEASADVPGPDMVYIPPSAVVGRFLVDTPIYTMPDPSAATTPIMTAGMSAWVYGVDPSGHYYLVMFAGSFFWVPVETMGPNYDDVWNGRPLPNNITGGPGSGRFEGGPGSGAFEGGPGSGAFEGGPGSGAFEGGPGSGAFE